MQTQVHLTIRPSPMCACPTQVFNEVLVFDNIAMSEVDEMRFHIEVMDYDKVRKWSRDHSTCDRVLELFVAVVITVGLQGI